MGSAAGARDARSSAGVHRQQTSIVIETGEATIDDSATARPQ